MSYTAAQIAEYVSAVFEPVDIVEIRCIRRSDEEKPSTFHTAADLPAQADNLACKNKSGWNIYVGVNPRKHHGGKSAVDVLLARVLFADCDNCTHEEAAERLKQSGLPAPTLTISSGHGVHFYWRLEEPIKQLSEWTKHQKHIIELLGSDNKVHDAPRIMRLPGLQNVKSEPFVQCCMIGGEPSRHRKLADLSRLIPVQLDDLPVETGSNHRVDRTNGTNGASRTNRMASEASAHSVAWNRALEGTIPICEGQREDCLWRFARLLKSYPQFADATAKQCEPFLRSEWFSRALPNITTKEFDATRIGFNRAWKHATVPMGVGPIESLMKLVETVAQPPEAKPYDTRGIRLLVTLCAILQAVAGDNVFFLACRKAADILSEDNFSMVNAWLTLLKDDGLLIEIEKGKAGNRRATRWRYTGTPVSLPRDDSGVQAQS